MKNSDLLHETYSALSANKARSGLTMLGIIIGIASVVFIVALEKEVFPNARAVRDQGHAQEERRLFYVALTRARKRLAELMKGTTDELE